MRHVKFAETAIRDIRQTLRDGEEKHGIKAKKRYSLLIATAITHLRKDAESIGVKLWDENRFMYHLRFSRSEAIIEGVKVNDPSHYIFFKVSGEEIEILRLLHEKSDFERHF